ncbi:MAG: pyridoxal phosphate-dependent aminotransferase [bacterium]|nr:pyridoxal phosphate-dependent aminotransferase [bacterium]
MNQMDAKLFSSFAERISNTAENELTTKMMQLSSVGVDVIDLVNVPWFENGLRFDPKLVPELYQAAATTVQTYHPDAKGKIELRNAIAAWYRRRGVTVLPENIVITPGTSLAYFLLFRMFSIDQGEVMCPEPSYPLFDDIAELSGLQVRNYPLEESSGWRIWADRINNRVTKDTRAICLVSPHNPTGAVHSEAELTELSEVCRRHQLPVIFDEVFSEFRFTEAGKVNTTPLPRPTAINSYPLSFLLNGFSKALAMPGHKIGWVVVDGTDSAAVNKAVKALTYLTDTFLPVSEIAQSFAANVLSLRDGLTADDTSRMIAELLAIRRSIVINEFANDPRFEFHHPAGGVYFVVALPFGLHAEDVSVGLLEEEHIFVHPGFFYNIPGEHIVFTYIMESERLRSAIKTVHRYLSNRIQ